ncbi:MAG: UbiA family prenyltransferase [Thermodesulfobacteriota bacterium]
MRLFRADAAVIAFGSFLTGAHLASGAKAADLLAAVLVTAFSANFCYSFNAYTDWPVDAINKPRRPIPRGLVSPRGALVYSLFLLAGSLVFPFFLANNTFSLLCFLLIPALGLAYSANPVRLKERPPFSVLTVSLGLILPLVIGYANAGGMDARMYFFFGALFLFCASLVGLKDVEDVAGDTALSQVNLYDRYGSRLLAFSIAGLAATSVYVALTPIPSMLKTWLLLLLPAEAACILCHLRFGWNLARLYHRIIRLMLLLGAGLCLYLL